MQKDYKAVPTNAAEQNESEFVEAFWTQCWEERADVAQANKIMRREEYPLMEPLLRELPRGSRILDGGCGMGEWTAYLTDQGFNVVGMDLSRRTIERLCEKQPNHHFVYGDIRRTQFEDASFDAYFSWGVFEHFENGLGECVAEAFRILKPGGLLFVSVPYQNWRHILMSTRDSGKWDPAYDRQLGDYRCSMRFYQWRLTRSELRRELGMHGFFVRSIIPIHRLEGVTRLLHWQMRWPESRTMLYRVTRRLLSVVLPADYISHMIMAIAEKRPET